MNIKAPIRLQIIWKILFLMMHTFGTSEEVSTHQLRKGQDSPNGFILESKAPNVPLLSLAKPVPRDV